MRTSVTVRVPATTANMGPGFDSIGMALDLWNELTLERVDEFEVQILGEGAAELPRDESNMIVRGVALAYETACKPLPTFRYICTNRIPFGAGLGSSSAALVSGLLAGLVMADHELPVDNSEMLLQLAAKVEGHVDNLAPAIYGGMQIGVFAEGRWHSSPVNIPYGLQCIMFTPDMKSETKAARALLPDEIPRKDAVFNIGRAALLVNAFASGNLSDLKYATEDALHQPARAKVQPAIEPLVRAAMAAGAHGAFLSGAGSTIMAITSGRRGDVYAQASMERKDHLVRAEMVAAATAIGLKGRDFITKPTLDGAQVIAISEVPVVPKVHYRSTRDVESKMHSFEHVVMRGLAPDGGLFVPSSIPEVSLTTMEKWASLPFPELAVQVMSLYIDQTEIPQADLRGLLHRSYATFHHPDILPLVQLSDDDSLYVLEQFHGPTCAFKDVALQFVGNLFEYFLQRRADAPRMSPADAVAGADDSVTPANITVLGATSGDTGSAAIEGLRGKANIRAFILHPKGRVAAIQEAQMTTVLDANIHNVAIEGTFDDCQAIVKELFNDPKFREQQNLAAINSINWARILAQIVYYFYAYLQWSSKGPGRFGRPLRFCVPSGNFGNALACYYARRMGLPVREIIVATNANDILHRFFASGDFTKKTVEPTLAPAMDITIPSNFERFLFHHCGENPSWIAKWMTVAKDTIGFVMACGRAGDMPADVQVADRDDPTFLPRAREIFKSYAADDATITETVTKFMETRKYILCPHSASGIYAATSFLDTNSEPESKDDGSLPSAVTPIVSMATAHPGKFADSVKTPVDETGKPMAPEFPDRLRNLLELPRRCLDLPNSAAAVAALLQEPESGTPKSATTPARAGSGCGSGCSVAAGH